MRRRRAHARPDNSFRQLASTRVQLLEVGRVIGRLEEVADHLEAVVNRHWPAVQQKAERDA